MTDAPLTRRAVIAAGAALAACPASSQPPAMRPRIRRLAPALDRIVDLNTPIETIVSGQHWAEGPVWMPGDGGALLFSDTSVGATRRWRRGAAVTEVLTATLPPGTDPATVREGGSNGMALAPDGGLLIADSGGRSIARVDLATRRRQVLADRFEGKRLNSPNDLVVARDGAIYFTDPSYGLVDGDRSPVKELPFNGVYRWQAGRPLALVDRALPMPNGIGLSPDGRVLYVSVSDRAAPGIHAYALDAAGLPVHRRLLLDARPLLARGGPGITDGMKVAGDGTLFCSVPGGLMILSPAAEPLGLIEDGQPIANCAFGEDGRTLFLASKDRVLRLRLRLNGWARAA